MITIALNSDHFKNAFSGSGTLFKENEDGDQGSREDFEEYLRFNYEKKVDFQQKNLVKVKDKVSQFFQNFFLPLENVANVAAPVLEIVQVPNAVSQGLYLKCVDFLGAQLTNSV